MTCIFFLSLMPQLYGKLHILPNLLLSNFHLAHWNLMIKRKWGESVKTGGGRSLTDDVQHVLFRGFGRGPEKLAACCAACAAVVGKAALSMACEWTHVCVSISTYSSARMCYCDFFGGIFFWQICGCASLSVQRVKWPPYSHVSGVAALRF